MSISAVILTRNEDENIEDCIKSISFCDEIIVIDDYSSDSTLSKLKDLSHVYKRKIKVFKRSLEEDFSQQLNFGLNLATEAFILFIDPDERISEDLKNEILQFIRNDSGEFDGLVFKRIDYIWGKWLTHGELKSFRSTRIVRKGKGEWKRRVHQTLSVQGPAMNAVNPILHYPHKTLNKFIANINKWSTFHAMANHEEGKTASIFKIIIYPVAHFIKNYILRFGFLDGMQGFVFALIMASHSFLSWSKQWMLQKSFLKI